jgi:hypothetical protein
MSNITGLISYWPINPNDTLDHVTHRDVQYCVNASFVPDRFNNPKSALYLNNGYCQVPADVYFNGSDFTIMAWFNSLVFRKLAHVIDFGCGPSCDNIIAALSNTAQSIASNTVFVSSTSYYVNINSPFNLARWTHLATVLNATHMLIYLDGVLQNTVLMSNRPRNLIRNVSFIGNSNWFMSGDESMNGYLDDIKIYRRALSAREIINAFNS